MKHTEIHGFSFLASALAECHLCIHFCDTYVWKMDVVVRLYYT
jgi:hypothetical protein